jgi:zinc D-Ala-D-Ala carboxypeptidase
MTGFFTDDELKCHCCGKLLIDPEFLRRLNIARAIARIPFIVMSGYRCEKHNIDVGSTSTNHTSGKAADIKYASGLQGYNILDSMLRAGMKGIGIGPTFIHCDTNHHLPALWTY